MTNRFKKVNSVVKIDFNFNLKICFIETFIYDVTALDEEFV